jgi:hypothetical protein
MTFFSSLNMNASLIAATKLSNEALFTIGILGGMTIIMWAFSNWRLAVKSALVVALLEGAIRKWVFPSGQELVYFLKDVILIGAYTRFFMAPDLNIRANKLRAPVTMVLVCCMLLLPATINPNIGSFLLAVYGFKIYVFYIPLMFMIPYLFRTQEEMVRQLTWYALLAIPIGLLGILQWRSGVSSIWNVYADQASMDSGGATTFGFGERVRVTGTFSYITGHTTFVIFFAALTVALLSLKEVKWKWLLMGVSLPLILGNGLMGGSRGSLFTVAFVVAGFAIAALSGRIGTNKNYVGMLVGGMIVCAAGGVYVFSDAMEHWNTRYKSGQEAGETVAFRAMQMPLDALKKSLNEAAFNGYGIGATHPAPEAIRRKLRIPPPKRKAPVFDTELGQVLGELGIFGWLGWYVMRVWLIFTIFGAYIKCPPGPVRPLILAALMLSGPHLVISVVLNHTANILLWALMGFGMIPYLEPAKIRRHTHLPRQQLANA